MTPHFCRVPRCLYPSGACWRAVKCLAPRKPAEQSIGDREFAEAKDQARENHGHPTIGS